AGGGTRAAAPPARRMVMNDYKFETACGWGNTEARRRTLRPHHRRDFRARPNAAAAEYAILAVYRR
ncbi:hypothetical protein, partial [Burkholderia pseudomallei]|uniref:hypothetical protein n=1 Tax=Burkholderia pseudomallei TaxID=28450 RepID=UPI001EE6831E